MTPDQLRELATMFERSEPPPSLQQTPGDYVVSDTAHKMSSYLRTLAHNATTVQIKAAGSSFRCTRAPDHPGPCEHWSA